MTRGRCGSLGLHRAALSSAPPRRFIPALLLRPQEKKARSLFRAPRQDEVFCSLWARKRLEEGSYEPRLCKSSLACCSAFFVVPLASAPGFRAWIALFRGRAFSPSATLHDEPSAPVCTPVIAALRQVKFRLRL